MHILFLALAIIGITRFHSLIPLHLPAFHAILQRLYYLPIIAATAYRCAAASIMVSGVNNLPPTRCSLEQTEGAVAL